MTYPRIQYQWQADEAERKATYKDFKRWQKIVAAKKGWQVTDSRLTGSLINTERANQETTISSVQINMNVVKVPYRVGRIDKGGWDKNASHFQVKIWINGDEKRAFVFTYSQGSGIKSFPTIREILYSFMQDASAGAQSFRDFCDNMGMESDSRESYKSYETCVEVFEWFLFNRIFESQIQNIAGTLQEADNRGDLNNEALIESVATGFMEMPTTDEDNVPF